MRIVLAEDEALLREGLVMLLEHAGHDVVASVATATELVHVVKRNDPAVPPDIVITDVRMPPGRTDDGLRAAIELRRDRPHLPILLLSQYLGNEYLQRLLDSAEDDPRSGGVGYLLKDRVAHVHEFMQALQAVASGGVVVDRKVISALMRRSEDRLERLTPREREVLQHVSAGETNHGIAEALHLSDGAVVKHIGAIFDKLGLSQREGNRRVLAVLAFLDHP
ncbi:response regulator transcription factor [Actinomyces gerencseriae]|uniref:response regulator transcription factor n=1 Tax=Actinomyces gerencseriae TaxID=52769 RepID=UPI0003F9A617|nr:response regulator transcription factor [Actinomyces gerencseriae]